MYWFGFTSTQLLKTVNKKQIKMAHHDDMKYQTTILSSKHKKTICENATCFEIFKNPSKKIVVFLHSTLQEKWIHFMLCCVLLWFGTIIVHPNPSGLSLHSYWGNLLIASVPVNQPCAIWVNKQFEFIMKSYHRHHITKHNTPKHRYFVVYCIISYHKKIGVNTKTSPYIDSQ